jgi:hypothetical protein
MRPFHPYWLSEVLSSSLSISRFVRATITLTNCHCECGDRRASIRWRNQSNRYTDIFLTAVLGAAGTLRMAAALIATSEESVPKPTRLRTVTCKV